MTEITLDDLIVRRRMEVECPLCTNVGKVILTGDDGEEIWKNPRPCPVCKGVGQLSKERVPTPEEIEMLIINYKF